ncbi:MAG TPA: type III pantothenate kinase [Accumulibacter sp.]|jgi:type III pantothenate kinase|nr:type III pantothenate kinase [Accumulibacter sp.]HQC80904.1 type III pantothenate kinase [Accumulibacter sp.]
MIVAIDAGNSRIKWGVHDGNGWLDSGVLATADAAFLGEAADEWPTPAIVVVCNVAGSAVAATILSVLDRRRDTVSFLHASAECCGVRSSYTRPAQLGADRWAAMIGARAFSPAPCLVVCAGTATTVDLLDAEGVFGGGVILPGFDLMRSALADNTAQLPFAEGVFRALPCCTGDAIYSGCLQAQVGAVERMFALLAGKSGARCLLTGGGAGRLAEHLKIPFQLADNLILTGLVRYAASL